MQLRKRKMSQCQVPCHLGRMDLVGVVVVGAGSTVVGAETEVAAAAKEPQLNERCRSQVWGWQKGLNNRGNKVDQVPVESMGRRHGNLRDTLVKHGDPGG